MIDKYIVFSFFAALLFSISALIFKINSDKKGDENLFMFGLFCVGSIGFFCVSLYSISFDNISLYLIAGIIIGVAAAFSNIFFMRALSILPVGVVTPIINLNVAIIVIASMLFFGEKLTIIEVIGISCIFMGLILFQLRLKSTSSPEESWWNLILITALILMTIRNGGLKVTDELNLNNTFVLLYAHCFAFMYFSLKLLTNADISKLDKPNLLLVKFSLLLKNNSLLLGTLAGFFSFLGLFLYGVALNNATASIVVPIFSLYTIMFYLWARLFTQEILKRNQLISLALCILGTMLISIGQ